jgi:hypothetical protein
LFAITADPNRNTLDPDMLIQGITPYLMANIHDATNLTNSLTQLYDFFARYVRKLHSDRHIKNTMTSNPGKSFLEMIGPSDVAYVICMLKNSMIRWMQDPTDGTSSAKQLYTRGESKKRQFGKSTMSEEGMKFFQAGVKNWRPAFDQKGPLYGSMKRGWDEWLREDASVVNKWHTPHPQCCHLFPPTNVAGVQHSDRSAQGPPMATANLTPPHHGRP